jgi:hypothetical protein
MFSAVGKAIHGSILILPTMPMQELFKTIFLGEVAYLCAKYMGPYLNDDGAIVFVNGVLKCR